VEKSELWVYKKKGDGKKDKKKAEDDDAEPSTEQVFWSNFLIAPFNCHWATSLSKKRNEWYIPIALSMYTSDRQEVTLAANVKSQNRELKVQADIRNE
jgi:hypothetical protein